MRRVDFIYASRGRRRILPAREGFFLGLGDGEMDGEGGTLALLGLEADFPGMLLDDLERDGQAQPRAALLRREIGLEDLGEELLWYARARVRDR
jgi:hypothetical protein